MSTTPTPTTEWMYGVDQFGIKKAYPDATNAIVYTSYKTGGTYGGNDGYRYHILPPLERAHEVEMTSYVKVTDLMGNKGGNIHLKLGGGHHYTDERKYDACCYDMLMNFGTKTTEVMRKECPHPDYWKTGYKSLFSNPRDIVNKWIGIKGVKVNQDATGWVHTKLWLDVDSNGDLTKQNWRKFIDFIDKGQVKGDPILKPRGNTHEETLRVSFCKYEAKYISLREIKGVYSTLAN